MSTKKAPAKSATKPAAKSVAKRMPFQRHGEKIRDNIVAFLKAGNTNAAAKAKFGVSAHFAGKLRKEAGVTPTVAKIAKKGPAAKAVEAVKGSKKAKVDADLL